MNLTINLHIKGFSPSEQRKNEDSPFCWPLTSDACAIWLMGFVFLHTGRAHHSSGASVSVRKTIFESRPDKYPPTCMCKFCAFAASKLGIQVQAFLGEQTKYTPIIQEMNLNRLKGERVRTDAN